MAEEDLTLPAADPSPPLAFAAWVQEHGGDEQFVGILTAHGFSSKLSLSNLDVSAMEATGLLEQLNYGQKCLLRGLIQLCRTQSGDSGSSTRKVHGVDYGAVTEKVQHIGSKAKKGSSTRTKLGQLFRFNPASSKAGSSKVASAAKVTSAEETGSDSDDFQPVPLNREMRKRLLKKKSVVSTATCAVTPPPKSGKGKQPAKRKVKEFRLKVVALPRMMSLIPAPSERRVHEVWVRATASGDEVSGKIQSVLGWKEKPQYLYAQGKNIRPASLSDVEGADSWEVQSIRALMGTGCLYVVKMGVSEATNSDTEVSNDT